MKEDDLYRHVQGSPELGQWERDHSLRCSLVSPELGVLDQMVERLDGLLALPELNPLYVCLAKFWDMEAFAQRLVKPYKTVPKKIPGTPQQVFQRTVADLLNLAGFQAVELGAEEFVRDPVTKFNRCTLDILAYYRAANTLILGACTTDAPNPEDTTKLLETQAVLSQLFPEDTTVRIIPMIFSALQQAGGEDRGVRILNAARLEKLLALIKSGLEERFLALLRMPFGDLLDDV